MTRLEEDGGVLVEGDWLPLTGLPVVEAKAMLKDAWGIPYFADAIVNGRQVPVAHVLQPGDRLDFVQRFGVKDGDNKPIEQLIGEALVIAYPELREGAEKVMARNLSADHERAALKGMVDEWAVQQFGPLDASTKAILADSVQRLQVIEAVLRQVLTGPGSNPDDLTDTEEFILEALGTKTMKAAAIATAAQLTHNSNLKTALSHLVKRRILFKGRDGYFRKPQHPS